MPLPPLNTTAWGRSSDADARPTHHSSTKATATQRIPIYHPTVRLHAKHRYFLAILALHYRPLVRLTLSPPPNTGTAPGFGARLLYEPTLSPRGARASATTIRTHRRTLSRLRPKNGTFSQLDSPCPRAATTRRPTRALLGSHAARRLIRTNTKSRILADPSFTRAAHLSIQPLSLLEASTRRCHPRLVKYIHLMLEPTRRGRALASTLQTRAGDNTTSTKCIRRASIRCRVVHASLSPRT